MVLHKRLRVISIAFYLLIMLMGQIIAIPFFCWLVYNLFAFGSIDQLFALLASVGLVMIWNNHRKIRTAKILAVDIVCFFLLISPFVWRMTEVPIGLFSYMAFIIPATLFVLFYIAALFFGCKQYVRLRRITSLKTTHKSSV